MPLLTAAGYSFRAANLTEQAFTINMELGLLLTGGTLPGQVEEQFDRLIGTGILEEA